ncbi:MAG TPA: ABC transporter ATP-binding protein, partial [Bacillales bacterium]|nr:ABC transporter ATP-binding protein [Bacillales bacterium]
MGDLETFRKLQDFYWPYKRYFIGSMIFLILVTSVTVLYPIVLQLAIDQGIKGGHYNWIPYLAFGFVAIMAFKGISAYLQQYWVNLFSIYAIYELRQGLYKKLQFLPFRFYDNAHTGDLMSRLTADVMAFGNFLSFGFSQMLRFILIVGFSLVIMFYYSWQLALITVLMTPFLAATVYKFDRSVHPAFRKVRKSLASLNTRVQENVSGVTTVKALSQEDFEIDRFGKQNELYKDNYLFTSSLWAKYFPVMEFIGDFTVVFLLGFGGWRVVTGHLSPG